MHPGDEADQDLHCRQRKALLPADRGKTGCTEQGGSAFRSKILIHLHRKKIVDKIIRKRKSNNSPVQLFICSQIIPGSCSRVLWAESGWPVDQNWSQPFPNRIQPCIACNSSFSFQIFSFQTYSSFIFQNRLNSSSVGVTFFWKYNFFLYWPQWVQIRPRQTFRKSEEIYDWKPRSLAFSLLFKRVIIWKDKNSCAKNQYEIPVLCGVNQGWTEIEMFLTRKRNSVQP